jgi:hypothetical protein
MLALIALSTTALSTTLSTVLSIALSIALSTTLISICHPQSLIGSLFTMKLRISEGKDIHHQLFYPLFKPATVLDSL